VPLFDAATAIRPSEGASVFDTDIDPDWTVGGKPNGGYLLALLGRAARTVARASGQDTWEVVSSTVTYLRAPDLGPAVIRTTVLREGRTASQVRAELLQEGAALVDAVFVLGSLAKSAAPRYSSVRPHRIPPPEECFRLPSQIPGGAFVGILEFTDLRMDPSVQLFGPPEPNGDAVEAELRAWTRFDDGRAPDPLSLLYFADAIPPATLPIGSSGWVPTLQMSVYVRAVPAPGWLGIRMEAQLVADGTVDETCTLWDSTGAVVAQAYQLARVRFPDEAT
jgi:acyl-coenzyme A thioesterase PaaI-like protein